MAFLSFCNYEIEDIMFKVDSQPLQPFYAFIQFWITLKGVWVKGIIFPKVL